MRLKPQLGDTIWGVWVPAGVEGDSSLILVSDGHWVNGTLDISNMGTTLRHEGTHEWLTSGYHDNAFWDQMNTCYAN